MYSFVMFCLCEVVIQGVAKQIKNNDVHVGQDKDKNIYWSEQFCIL